MITTVWDFRCHAACDNRWATNTSLNDTIWSMREAGWIFYESEEGEWRIYCPEHVEDLTLSKEWLVECSECDEEEWCESEEAAVEFASWHEDEHPCFCCDHTCTVLSPDKQEKRKQRYRDWQAEADAKRAERLAQERYVEYLIQLDQETRRRDMDLQESSKPILKYEIGNHIATALLIGVALFLALIILSGCGADKYTEKYHDAQRSGDTNSQPADTGTMPDGFSNYASKCDHGNRVYTLFHEDGAYGSLAVVPNAEGC